MALKYENIFMASMTILVKHMKKTFHMKDQWSKWYFSLDVEPEI